MSRFFCLWIEQFPTWATALNDASLQGKPLLIYRDGRVLSASPEALQAGVQIGWPLPRAQHLIADAVSLAYHAPTAEAVWQDVLDALYGLTPLVESLRPGLALADLKHSERVEPLLKQWNARGGVADNRVAAELAAYTAARGELQIVPPLGTVRFLQTVPLRCLQEAGIRPDTLERMSWFGWRNVGHLRPLAKKQLLAQFDQGELLFRYGQCDDIRPVTPYRPPSSIPKHQELEEAISQPGEMEPLLSLLIQEAVAELEGRLCHSLVVRLENQSGNSAEWLRAVRLLPDATGDVRVLTRAALVALQTLLRPGLSVRRVEVQLCQLAYQKPVQAQLFGRNRSSLQKALEMMERRWPGVLKRIVMVDANAYLPEKAFRLEPISTPQEKAKTTAATKKRASTKAKAKPKVSAPKTPSFLVPS